jgi:formylglycine-generating enzyme required for sulfatase activity
MLLVCALNWGLICVPARPGNGPRLHDFQVSPEGYFRFNFGATAGQSYQIEASADLLVWAQITNVIGTGEPIWIEDQDASLFKQRYYHIGIRPTPIPNMVYIPPGSFTMGSPDAELDRDENEGPQTRVTLTHGFWMSKYEVNQKDFVELTGISASVFENDSRLPVDFASWAQSTNFIQKLNDRERAAGRLPEGYIYRLPTEAEWEYACRAGTTTAVAIGSGNNLSSAQANFDGTFPYAGAASGPDRHKTIISGSFAPNAWGLYDMHGNVAEWCQDVFGPLPGGAVTDPKGPQEGTTRVIRGGMYLGVGKSCRSAKRDGRSQTFRNFGQGFRVVLANEA